MFSKKFSEKKDDPDLQKKCDELEDITHQINMLKIRLATITNEGDKYNFHRDGWYYVFGSISINEKDGIVLKNKQGDVMTKQALTKNANLKDGIILYNVLIGWALGFEWS